MWNWLGFCLIPWPQNNSEWHCPKVWKSTCHTQHETSDWFKRSSTFSRNVELLCTFCERSGINASTITSIATEKSGTFMVRAVPKTIWNMQISTCQVYNVTVPTSWCKALNYNWCFRHRCWSLPWTTYSWR